MKVPHWCFEGPTHDLSWLCSFGVRITSQYNDLDFDTRRARFTPMFVEMLRNHTERAIIISMFKHGVARGNSFGFQIYLQHTYVARSISTHMYLVFTEFSP